MSQAAVTSTRVVTSAARAGRGWAVAGVLAGVTGFAAFVVESGLAAFSEQSVNGDAARMYAESYDHRFAIAAVLPMLVLAGLSTVVFGAGLRRWLAAQSPAGSLLPDLAAAGTLLVGAMTLVGSGPVTEVFFGVTQEFAPADPDVTITLLKLMDTMAWVWVGLLLTTISVTWAALRHGAAPRWLGWVSGVISLLLIAVNVFPQQYLAGYLGAIWLVVAGAAFGLRRRSG